MNKRSLCARCEKRVDCSELCDAAERYARQDNVNRDTNRESDIKKGNPRFSIENFANDFRVLGGFGEIIKKMTDREIMVSILLKCDFPQQKIRKILKMRTQAFNNLLYQVRKKMYK